VDTSYVFLSTVTNLLQLQLTLLNDNVVLTHKIKLKMPIFGISTITLHKIIIATYGTFATCFHLSIIKV